MTRRGNAAVARAVLAVASVVAAVFAVLHASGYRHLEAAAAAKLSALNGPGATSTHGDIVWYAPGGHGAFGLRITPECSSLLLVVPFVALAAVLFLLHRMRPARVLFAVGSAVTLLVLGNQLRIGTIAYLVRTHGIDTGYEWGHLIIGPLVTLCLVTASLCLLFWVLLAGKGNRGRQEIA